MGHVLELFLQRVTSLQLQVRGSSLTVVSAYKLNSRVEYLAFLKTLGDVLEGSPTRDYIILQVIFNTLQQQ